MSLVAAHINPADGRMMFTLNSDGTLPSPQTWAFEVQGCAPSGTTLDIVNDITHDVDHGSEVALVEISFTNRKAKRLGCMYRTYGVVMTPQANLLDIAPTDGNCGSVTQTASASWGESTSITLLVVLRGANPNHGIVSAALGDDMCRAICWQESRWAHFDTSGLPKKNVNVNGTVDWGIMQINQASIHLAWHWPSNIAAGKAIFSEKLRLAKIYLDQHGKYTQDMLNHEAVQRYNGGVYYKWNGSAWIKATTNGYADSIFQIMQNKPWSVAIVRGKKPRARKSQAPRRKRKRVS